MEHCSTPQQRRAWIVQLLASPASHGMVSQMSREHHVSRQTLYRWKQKVEHALQDLFRSAPQPEPLRGDWEREVLTLLIEGHASYRHIQSCLHKLMDIWFCLTFDTGGEPSFLRTNSPSGDHLSEEKET